MNTYTQPIEDGMRVKHDAMARLTIRSGQKVLEDDLVSVDTIGGALVAASVTYNRLSYSGGVSWWNPTTGKSISKPTFTVRVRADDVLTGDEFCDCEECQGTYS